MMNSKPKPFNSLCIISRDVARVRDFYRDVLQAEAQGDAVFAWISTPRADLTFYDELHMEQMAPGCMAGAGYGGCVLEFGVEDVDAEFERLVLMNVPIVKPPTTQSWGIRSVWFRDPDGNIVNFNAPATPQG
jgi:catechol 2,3-dioxygenase-like lactoylglutathione lyase family enzyme